MLARVAKVRDRPIGVFDSGFGGLTVARALIDLLPHEDVVYLGDTARYPYGSKPQAEVREYALQIARLLVREHDVKALVVACNTAAAAALRELEQEFDVPVFSVIEPGVRALTQVTRSGRVGVIGTTATIGSGAYQTAVADLGSPPGGKPIELVCCATPGFVEFVERGETDSEQMRILAHFWPDPSLMRWGEMWSSSRPQTRRPSTLCAASPNVVYFVETVLARVRTVGFLLATLSGSPQWGAHCQCPKLMRWTKLSGRKVEQA